MYILDSLLSAVSLSMDAFAAAVCVGVTVAGVGWQAALRMGLACGAFQFLMPLFGWLLGAYAIHLIEAWDHWIAFGILAFVGGNMMWGSLRRTKTCPSVDPTRSRALLYLALATSMDAFAVGAGFGITARPVALLAVGAGTITLALCFVGVIFGRFIGGKAGGCVEFVGGVVLFLTGLHILVTHLSGG